MKYLLINLILKLVTINKQIYRKSASPIKTPSRFLTFPYLPPQPILDELIKAYQDIFSEPPWFENWSYQKVVDKLEKELSGNKSFITVMGNGNTSVTGFSWGEIVPLNELPERVAYALGMESSPNELLNTIKGKEILFFDEFAILSSFRSGIEPVRFLLRPGLELGYEKGVFQTMFWSTPDSRIIPLALYMGYRPVYSTNARGKKIIFLLNKDFRPLLKMAQNFKGNVGVKFMKVAYRITGTHKKNK